jgi:hypothetical protein
MQVSTKRPMAIPPGLEFLELADRFVMEEEDVKRESVEQLGG